MIFLSTDEAAALLRVKPPTLVSWRWKGKGPAYVKCGHRVLYDRDDLIGWANRNRVATDDAGGAR